MSFLMILPLSDLTLLGSGHHPCSLTIPAEPDGGRLNYVVGVGNGTTASGTRQRYVLKARLWRCALTSRANQQHRPNQLIFISTWSVCCSLLLRRMPTTRLLLAQSREFVSVMDYWALLRHDR